MLRAHIDFARKLRDWDGFGICFHDHALMEPQKYFSLQNSHLQYLNSFFGNDGLRLGIIKLFIDPYRQEYCQSSSDEDRIIDTQAYKFYDLPLFHLELCQAADRIVKNWGGTLKIMLTCLCPPAWMTKQKELSGRDLDPANRIDYGRYMVAWAKYLAVDKQLPIHCLSLHDKGEMWELWDEAGLFHSTKHINLYWSPEMVVDFLKLVRRQLDNNSLQNIGLTPGETASWGHFYDWGYAHLIHDDPLALASLGLLTSNTNASPEYCDFCSIGVDYITEKRSDLHAWVSSAWLNSLNPGSISFIHNQIYRTKINAIIFNSLIGASSDNNFKNNGYTYLKPVCKAGQPGMGVCQVACNKSDIFIIGFSSNSTRNPDSFVVINNNHHPLDLPIEIRGSASGKFSVHRSSYNEDYQKIGEVVVKEGKINYLAPQKSVSGFYAVQ